MIFAVLAPEFNVIGTTRDEINDDFDQPFSNPAIRTFAAQAKSFASYVSPYVRDFIIWNEPNYLDTELDLIRFASLMYACHNEMNTLVDPPRIYWGGVHFGFAPDDDEWNIEDTGFMLSVYDALKIYKGITSDWPWWGINIHVHGNRGGNFPNNLARYLNTELRINRNEDGPIIVGEIGPTVEGFAAGEELTNSAGTGFFQHMFSNFDLLSLFSHHVRVEPGGHFGTRWFDEDDPGNWVDRSSTGKFYARNFTDDPNQAPWEFELEPYWNHVKLSFQRLHDLTGD